MDWMMNIERGEIWLINFNPTLGHEQAGIRPALIISIDLFNNSKAGKVVAIPLTSKYKGIPLDVPILPPNGGINKESFIKIEDIRSLSKERLLEKWGKISNDKLAEVENKIKLLLGF